MTFTIELKPETEASLLVQASAHGLELPKYVEQVLEGQAQGERLTPVLSAAERIAAWRSLTAIPVHPPLSDEAISRASMYETRG